MSTDGTQETAGDTDLQKTDAIADSMRPTISEVLQTLSEGEDMDTAVIIAGVINLQLGAMMRKQHRSHFGPQDAQIMVRICRMLLAPPPAPFSQYAPRNRQ